MVAILPRGGSRAAASLALVLALSLLVRCGEVAQEAPSGAQPALERAPDEEAIPPTLLVGPIPTPRPLLPSPLPLPPELRDRLRRVTSIVDALQVVPELQFRYLVPELRALPSLGMTQIIYRLPEEAADNPYLALVLGLPLPTRFGERLPPGIVAVVSQFPRDAVGVLGPFIWVQDGTVSRQLYGVDVRTAYRALRYPDVLLAEIYIEAPVGYPGPGPYIPFHSWSRIRGFIGEDLARGDIPWGTLYLWTGPDGSWRLREYPDIPPQGDAARLLWNFNPRDPQLGLRGFGVPPLLQWAQDREQRKSLANQQRLQDNVGPAIIFRTDQTTGQTDILAVAAYLFLQNPQLLRDILYQTPLPDGSPPRPDDLLVGAGDLHYSSNGKMGLLLAAEQDGLPMDVETAAERPVDFLRVKNHIGFYLGLRRPAGSQ